MTIIFVSIFIILLIVSAIVAFFLFFQTKKENKESVINFVNDVLDKKGFYPKKILCINSSVTIAINPKCTTIAVIVNR